jgi:predicted nucleic acid-binding protein
MLLDTSGLLCLHHAAELFHKQACAAYLAARTRITHNLILAEFVPLAHVRGLPSEPALRFIADLIGNLDIEVVWVDEKLQHAAVDLLLARLDKTYSLCDAVSFVLMKERGVTDALTTDHHFEQEGFRRLLKAS